MDPCIPAEWPGFAVMRKWRGAIYRIRVENPEGVEKGVREVLLNGVPCRDGVVPPCPEGSVNDVLVRMGRRDGA